MKVSGSKYIFLVLYFDDILFATNDTDMFNMQSYSSGKAPIVKDEKFSKGQCP